MTQFIILTDITGFQRIININSISYVKEYRNNDFRIYLNSNNEEIMVNTTIIEFEKFLNDLSSQSRVRKLN